MTRELEDAKEAVAKLIDACGAAQMLHMGLVDLESAERGRVFS